MFLVPGSTRDMDRTTTHSVMGQEHTSYVYDEAEVLSESEESLQQAGNKKELAENSIWN